MTDDMHREALLQLPELPQITMRGVVIGSHGDVLFTGTQVQNYAVEYAVLALRDFSECCRSSVRDAHTKARLAVLDCEHGKLPSHYLPMLRDEENRIGDLLDKIEAIRNMREQEGKV